MASNVDIDVYVKFYWHIQNDFREMDVLNPLTLLKYVTYDQFGFTVTLPCEVSDIIFRYYLNFNVFLAFLIKAIKCSNINMNSFLFVV